jgi:hypothetical protein
MGDTLAAIVQVKGRSDLADDTAILRGAYPECFSVRQWLRGEQVIDVKGGEIRSDDGAGNIAAFDIVPGPCIAIHSAMPPTNHSVRSIKVTVCKMLWTDKVAQVFACRRDWHDKADVHTVGFDKNLDSVFWLLPVFVSGNLAADQSRQHVEADGKDRPRDDCAYCRPQAVDAKQFQV